MALTAQTDGGALEPSERTPVARDRLRTTLLVANGVVNVAAVVGALWIRTTTGFGGLFLAVILLGGWGLLELLLFLAAVVFTVRRQDRGSREIQLLADWALFLAASVTILVVVGIVGNAWSDR